MMAALLALQLATAGPARPPLPLTPAEAADVLRRSPGLSNADNWPSLPPVGDRLTIIGGTPWLPWPAERPPTRLDGTPLWLPPTVYGAYRYPHIPPDRPGVDRVLHMRGRESHYWTTIPESVVVAPKQGTEPKAKVERKQ